MLKMIQWFRGYVRIKVWGRAPERFLNLCSHREILLWDISKKEEAYSMCISLKAFRRLKDIARKTGVRVVITERVGLPFLMPVLRARVVFCVGGIGAIVFWCVSSLFVWDIECSGNYQITDEVILGFLETQDISVGMRKSEVDIQALEKALRREFNKITWTSAKFNGTRLHISIKENDVPLKPQLIRSEGASHLIAEYDGTITSMIVRSGVPVAGIGDYVREGMILVEGKIPITAEDGTIKAYQYVEADADIMLEHIIKYNENLPHDYIQKEYTGRQKKRGFIRFGEWELKLAESTPFLLYDSVIVEKVPFLLKKLGIPIGWGSMLSREYLNVEHSYRPEEVKTILTEKMLHFFENLSQKGVHIIEKNVRIESDGKQWVMEAEIKVEEPVNGKLEIIREENLP